MGCGISGHSFFAPFSGNAAASIAKTSPATWAEFDANNIDWNLYLNTLFWNLNYWDSISTLAEEVKNPQKPCPRLCFLQCWFCVGGYLASLASAIGVIRVSREDSSDGDFASAGRILGGAGLQIWVTMAAALSNTGMFEAEMSSDPFMLLGMGEAGRLPATFCVRSRHGTPILGTIFSACGALLLSSESFQEIVVAKNYLYCIGMFAEFAAFVSLRVRKPDMVRPYDALFLLCFWFGFWLGLLCKI